MNELPKVLTTEEQRLKEEREMHENWLRIHPEYENVPESLRECASEVAEFEAMIASFELSHPLAELMSIVELTQADAPYHPVREPARLALALILKSLNVLKDETDISKDEHDRLKLEYKRLSRAVGVINNGIVDHNR